MALIDMANNAVARQQLIDHLKDNMREQAAQAGGSVSGVPDEIRTVMDDLDRVELERAETQQTGESARKAIPGATAFLLGGSGLGTGAIVASLLGAPGLACGIAGGIGAATIVLAGIARAGSGYNVDWAAGKMAEHDAQRAGLQQSLDGLCRQGRDANKQRLLEELPANGADVTSADEMRTGRSGMVFLQQVAHDPEVLVAAQRLKKVEDTAAHATAALAGDRNSLFATEPARMQATWAEKGEAVKAVSLLGVVGVVVGTGAAAAAVLGASATAPAGLVAAVACVPLLRVLSQPLMGRVVEKSMRRDISADLTTAQEQIGPRREALDRAQQEAIAGYGDFLRTHPLSPTPAPSRPAVVAMDEGHVTIGGVRIDVNSGAGPTSS